MRTHSDAAVLRSQVVEEKFQAFVPQLAPKTRAVVDKQVDGSIADNRPPCGATWKRLVVHLGQLAGHMIEASGTVLRFYISDGKYRRQVFVLEAENDGHIVVFLPDVTAAATERGLLGKSDGMHYTLAHGSLEIETISADTREIPEYCKAMLGWGRKALRISLSSIEASEPVATVQRLSELAAEGWPATAAVPAVGMRPTRSLT